MIHIPLTLRVYFSLLLKTRLLHFVCQHHLVEMINGIILVKSFQMWNWFDEFPQFGLTCQFKVFISINFSQRPDTKLNAAYAI